MNTVQQQFKDMDTLRHQKNMTQSQQRNITNTVEGVVVNSMVLPTQSTNIKEIYDTLVISKNVNYPSQLDKSDYPTKISDSALKNLYLGTVGVLGTVLGITYFIAQASKKKTKLPSWKTLPEVPRNIALNEESHFATYAMIQNPSTRTIIGASGVFLLSIAGIIGKNFVDGYKAIWIKKQEADIQRNLQEQLIAVETQKFSGKMQILRSMLTEKAKLFEKYLNFDLNSIQTSPAFKNFLSFKRKENDKNSKNFSIKSFAMLIATTVLLGLLAYLSLKNIQKTAKNYESYEKKMKDFIKELVKNSKDGHNKENLETIKKIMVSLSPDKNYIKETLSHLQFKDALEKEKYIQSVVKDVEKITQEAAEAIAGKPGHKASIYSHVDDVRGHFYNWVVNFDNAILGYLFAGLTAVTSFGYVGKQAVDAIKEAQVIRINAETELALQKRLISVELKNFYAKKNSVIAPLVEEFQMQAKNNKNKKELKVLAESILLEIKNGPPFVYS